MIENAKIQNAKEISELIKSSITACVADHRHDEILIEQWSSNKTPENVKKWIAHNFAISYIKNDEILGFLLMSKKGEILLSYVLPSHFQQGIGDKMLTAAIEYCQQNQIQIIHLESTLTAKEFYLKNGFEIIREIIEDNQLVAFEMQFTI